MAGLLLTLTALCLCALLLVVLVAMLDEHSKRPPPVCIPCKMRKIDEESRRAGILVWAEKRPCECRRAP